MNSRLRLACIVLASLMLLATIAFIVLEVIEKPLKGPQGIQGLPGQDAVLTLNSKFNFSTGSPNPNFQATPSISFVRNVKENIVTSSFILTALESQSLFAGETLPLLQLPTELKPKFEIGCIGIIINALNVNERHAVLYDESLSPNVQFYARSSFDLNVSDRFFVQILNV
jgi:hypothetical protein